ncbi:MAG: sulfite exporter TauE/SafE family protein [Aigarchaeota archaeon]|nr:sulfite exporter TauE/SafE family protein [Aigarchaeota archaeon]MDW7986885.1 sulfite exporter TauE/SafE family protein [Nitrososphaerota archaeon]
MIEWLFFILAGFVAQMIDGALGMAYGVSLNSMLLSLGLSPVVASFNVHFSEIFTSMVSGASHLKLGNVDKRLLWKLLIPGVLGGILGAYILTSAPTDIIKPIVSIYLLAMGVIIILKAIHMKKSKKFKEHFKEAPALALCGGFLDAVGGGGWGPLVTSTLIAGGGNPRISIGTVNLVEFFVTISQVATFAVFLRNIQWQIVTFLVIGGIIAAPIASYTCKRAPTRLLLVLVGILVSLLSIRNIYLSLT